MEIKVKFLEKSFVDDNGKSIKYYAISIPLVDGSTLDIPVKGDKAKLLLMSLRLQQEK